MSFSWPTFALQAINFLILVWLLKRFLFKPVSVIVAQRKAEITRAQAQAEAARQAAETARKGFEARQLEIESQRQSIVDQARASLVDERAKMIDTARADIERLKIAAGRQLSEERETAARELYDRSVQIAVELAERLLRELATPRRDELFLDRVLDQLDHLSAVERASLLGESAGESGQVIVTTSKPLDPESESKWHSQLSQRLGRSRPISFAVNDQLIAGAELKFPLATLHFNWRESLARAQRDLIQHENAS